MALRRCFDYRCVGWSGWLTISPHGSLVGSLLLTMVICLPLTDTWLSSITLQPKTPFTTLQWQAHPAPE